jgi:hypothetical protein
VTPTDTARPAAALPPNAEACEPPAIPRVVVYCDESCHDQKAHAWMAIGGLRMPRDRKPELTRALRQVREARGLLGEVKWRKVSASRLEDYKALADFFFDTSELRFRAIVVEQARVRMERHGRDQELAFYKFYYEMLEKWLEERAEYLILLDYKENRDADRYTTLQTYLQRHLRGKSWIADLTVINSRESPLAQLCDVLTGAVAAAYNGPRAGGAKDSLMGHIAGRAEFGTLRTSTGLNAEKFNIFRIELG